MQRFLEVFWLYAWKLLPRFSVLSDKMKFSSIMSYYISSIKGRSFVLSLLHSWLVFAPVLFSQKFLIMTLFCISVLHFTVVLWCFSKLQKKMFYFRSLRSSFTFNLITVRKSCQPMTMCWDEFISASINYMCILFGLKILSWTWLLEASGWFLVHQEHTSSLP